MKLLICNIGSSDLDRAQLPEFKDLRERERARRILADYAQYRPRLALPIIGKLLPYIQAQPGELTAVVLIVSDQLTQADVQPSDGFYETDTCLTGEIIARRLADETEAWQPVPPDRIHLWVIQDEQGGGRNPSDYDGVRRFFERRLPELHHAYPKVTAYLEVTGGTPAMTTGLLIVGTEVFGAHAEVLYTNPRDLWPHTLNTGKRLQSGPLRAALRSNVATFDYDAALRLVREQRTVIADRLVQGAPEVLDALLEYARCRFNFDFPGARAALQGGVDRAGDGRWRQELMRCYADVATPDRRQLLEEVYHGAAARFEVGAYADFLTQLVRFDENMLRLLCLDLGAVFLTRNGDESPDGSLIDQNWLRSEGISLGDGRRDVPTGRKVLSNLLKLLAQQYGEDFSALFAASDKLTPLVYLRNELTHSFEGVRKLDLAQRFAGKGVDEAVADTIVPHLATMFQLACGRTPGPSPFTRLNQFIDSLLHEVRD